MEDNVRLVDYLKVVSNRRWLVLGVVLALMFISGSINLLSPKVYKVTTAIDIGSVDNITAIDIEDVDDYIIGSPDFLMYKINNNYKLRAIREGKVSENEYKKIRTEQQGRNRVLISIDDEDTNRAVNILKEINRFILEEYQKLADLRKKEQETVIKIGNYQGSLIEEPSKNIKRIKEVYPLILSDMLDIPHSEFPEIEANLLGFSHVVIKINDKDVERGMAILNEIGKLVINEHNRKIAMKRDQLVAELEFLKARKKMISDTLMLIKNRERFLKKEIDDTKSYIDGLVNRLNRAESSNVDTGAGNSGIIRSIDHNRELLRWLKTELEVEIPEKKGEQRVELEEIIRNIKPLEVDIDNYQKTNVIIEPRVIEQSITPTVIALQPTPSQSPVKPGKLYISVLVGGVAGFVGGIFLAFLIEFIRTLLKQGM